jgi:hypothetical protein
VAQQYALQTQYPGVAGWSVKQRDQSKLVDDPARRVARGDVFPSWPIGRRMPVGPSGHIY